MKSIKIDPFTVVGITVRTSNLNGESARDIGALWSKFMNEDILNKIPNKVSNDIYVVYTNYDGDHLMPYTTLLGCCVKDLTKVPEKMIGLPFNGGNYEEFIAKGDLTQKVVYDTWDSIWQQNLDRNYKADFEVYGVKAVNPKDGEVSIFVGVRSGQTHALLNSLKLRVIQYTLILLHLELCSNSLDPKLL